MVDGGMADRFPFGVRHDSWPARDALWVGCTETCGRSLDKLGMTALGRGNGGRPSIRSRTGLERYTPTERRGYNDWTKKGPGAAIGDGGHIYDSAKRSQFFGELEGVDWLDEQGVRSQDASV